MYTRRLFPLRSMSRLGGPPRMRPGVCEKSVFGPKSGRPPKWADVRKPQSGPWLWITPFPAECAVRSGRGRDLKPEDIGSSPRVALRQQDFKTSEPVSLLEKL